MYTMKQKSVNIEQYIKYKSILLFSAIRNFTGLFIHTFIIRLVKASHSDQIIIRFDRISCI